MKEDNTSALSDYTFEEYHSLPEADSDRLARLATDDEWKAWYEKYQSEWEEYEKQELEKFKKEARVLYFKLFRAILAVVILVIFLLWWGNSDQSKLATLGGQLNGFFLNSFKI